MTSLRARIAVQKISEIVRNSKGKKSITLGTILREAGYSKQTSLKPKIVTESKGFKNEMDKYFPNEMIGKTHRELFGAVKLNKIVFNSCLSDIQIKRIIEGAVGHKVRNIVRRKGGNRVVCYYWSPDGSTRLKAVDMGYKIKNLYQDKGNGLSELILVNITNYGSNQNKLT